MAKKWEFVAVGYIEASTRTEAWRKASGILDKINMNVASLDLKPEIHDVLTIEERV